GAARFAERGHCRHTASRFDVPNSLLSDGAGPAMKKLPSSSTRRDFLRTSAVGLGGLYCGIAGAAPAPVRKAPAKAQRARFDHYDDAVLVSGEPPALAPESYTIVALPDTQNYAQTNPAAFLAQTEWIV